MTIFEERGSTPRAQRRKWSVAKPLAAALATCLALANDAGATAPAGRYSYPTANTVYDTISGLTWQRGVTLTSVTWSDADSDCSTLSVDTYTTGWRLPAVKELLTIVDYSETGTGIAIDPAAFQDTTGTVYWTNSCFPFGTGNCNLAWWVSFSNGTVSHSQLKPTQAPARCVWSG